MAPTPQEPASAPLSEADTRALALKKRAPRTAPRSPPCHPCACASPMSPVLPTFWVAIACLLPRAPCRLPARTGRQCPPCRLRHLPTNPAAVAGSRIQDIAKQKYAAGQVPVQAAKSIAEAKAEADLKCGPRKKLLIL